MWVCALSGSLYRVAKGDDVSNVLRCGGMATAHGLALSRAPLYNIDVRWEDILEVIN